MARPKARREGKGGKLTRAVAALAGHESALKECVAAARSLFARAEGRALHAAAGFVSFAELEAHLLGGAPALATALRHVASGPRDTPRPQATTRGGGLLALEELATTVRRVRALEAELTRRLDGVDAVLAAVESERSYDECGYATFEAFLGRALASSPVVSTWRSMRRPSPATEVIEVRRYTSPYVGAPPSEALTVQALSIEKTMLAIDPLPAISRAVEERTDETPKGAPKDAPLEERTVVAAPVVEDARFDPFAEFEQSPPAAAAAATAEERTSWNPFSDEPATDGAGEAMPESSRGASVGDATASTDEGASDDDGAGVSGFDLGDVSAQPPPEPEPTGFDMSEPEPAGFDMSSNDAPSGATTEAPHRDSHSAMLAFGSASADTGDIPSLFEAPAEAEAVAPAKSSEEAPAPKATPSPAPASARPSRLRAVLTAVLVTCAALGGGLWGFQTELAEGSDEEVLAPILEAEDSASDLAPRPTTTTCAGSTSAPPSSQLSDLASLVGLQYF